MLGGDPPQAVATSAGRDTATDPGVDRDPTAEPATDRDASTAAGAEPAATGSSATGSDAAGSDDDAGTGGPRRTGRRLLTLDVVLLLLAPLAAFLLLRVRPMTDQGLVDSWIYTGYQLNGSDLVRRFGADVYYWVRLGTTVPERGSSWLFGPLPGFFVLRYLLALLATAPLFVLVRRAVGRPAAWAVVVAVLASPVTWNAWGTDYPDALIFSYLLGATGLLNLPLRSGWPRIVAVAASGVLLSLAVHSQVVAAPLVAVVVLTHVLVAGRGWKSVLLTLVGLLVAFAGVTGTLIGIAKVWLGQTDIFTPTIDNYRLLQRPEQVPMWHSANNHWVFSTPSTFVPYLIVLAWIVLAVRDRARMTRAELAVGVGAGLAAVAWAGLQFLGTVATLEYRLYVSSLWALVLPVLGLVVVRVVGEQRSRMAWLAVALLAAAGIGLSFLPDLPVDLGRVRWVGLAVVVALAAVVVGTTVRRRLPVVAGLCGALVAVAVAGITVLPSHKPVGPDFTPLPQPQYGAVFGALGDRSFIRSYGLAAQLPGIIGPGQPGEQVLFWASRQIPGQTASDLPATYLWRFMPAGVPEESVRQIVIDQANGYGPDPLVIVTLDVDEAQQFVDTWAESGHPLVVSKKATATSNGLTVQVWLAQPADQLR